MGRLGWGQGGGGGGGGGCCGHRENSPDKTPRTHGFNSSFIILVHLNQFREATISSELQG